MNSQDLIQAGYEQARAPVDHRLHELEMKVRRAIRESKDLRKASTPPTNTLLGYPLIIEDTKDIEIVTPPMVLGSWARDE